MKRHYVCPLVVLASVLLVGLQPALAKKPPQEPPPPEPTATHELVSLGEGVNGFLLNNNGVVMAIVAGEIYAIVPADADGDGAPDTWYVDDDQDGINDLYHLVSPQTGPVTWAQMLGVNDWGTVVGAIQFAGQSASVPCYLEPLDTDGDGAADLWYQDDDADGINDLITPLEGEGYAKDINNFGVITGWANDVAVVWFDGTMQKLGYGGEGIAINDNGEVAGGNGWLSPLVFFIQPLDSDANGEPDTWFVDAGDGITNALAIETPGDWAWDINDSGLAVGGSGADAYMWQLDAAGNVTPTNLGKYPTGRALNTVAHFINASGVAVGTADVRSGKNSARKGFLVENGAIVPIEDRLSNPELLGSDSAIGGISDSGLMGLGKEYVRFIAVPIATP